MAEIFFSNDITLEGFNLGDSSISYPTNILDEEQIKKSITGGIVYAFDDGNQSNTTNQMVAYYLSSALPGDRFAIYRKSKNDTVKTYLGTIDNVWKGFSDYNVASNTEYQYIIETNPADQLEESISMVTKESVFVHWNKWTICDIEYDESCEVYKPGSIVFSLINNLNVGTINYNNNVVKYDTLGKYGKVIMNPQRYDSGSISCLIGDFTASDTNNVKRGTFLTTKETIDCWNEFLINKKLKLLKAPNGDMWVVTILDGLSRDTDQRSVSYPSTINFNWQEVMDVNKISILKW